MRLRNSFAVAALAAVCCAAPAGAQSITNNNSNASGYNNSNSSIPGLGSPSSSGSAGYNSNTLGQAQSLQQQLAAAQNALNGFNPAPSSTGPRYFARTSQDCNCGGTPTGGAQERAQLEANLAKAQADAAAFLESVKNPGSDKLGDVQAGAKVGPTW